MIKETVTDLLCVPAYRALKLTTRAWGPWDSASGSLPVPFDYMFPECLHVSFTVAGFLAGFFGAQIP